MLEKRLQIHPMVDVFPQLPPEHPDYINLRESIREIGLIQPIEVWLDDEVYWIIDGAHRFRAMVDLDMAIEPRHIKKYLGNRDSVLEHIYACNGARRNLNKSQRAVVAMELIELNPQWVEQALTRRQANLIQNWTDAYRKPSTGASDRKTSEKAAALLGCSHGSVELAQWIRRHDESLIPHVKMGGMSLWEAESEIKDKLREGVDYSWSEAFAVTTNRIYRIYDSLFDGFDGITPDKRNIVLDFYNEIDGKQDKLKSILEGGHGYSD